MNHGWLFFLFVFFVFTPDHDPIDRNDPAMISTHSSNVSILGQGLACKPARTHARTQQAVAQKANKEAHCLAIKNSFLRRDERLFQRAQTIISL